MGYIEAGIFVIGMLIGAAGCFKYQEAVIIELKTGVALSNAKAAEVEARRDAELAVANQKATSIKNELETAHAQFTATAGDLTDRLTKRMRTYGDNKNCGNKVPTAADTSVSTGYETSWADISARRAERLESADRDSFIAVECQRFLKENCGITKGQL